MERVLSNELGRFLLIITLGVIGLCTLLARNIGKVRENIVFQKSSIFYLLTSLMFFALAACAQWFLPKPIRQIGYLIALLAYLLLLGIAHVPLMNHYLKWTANEKSLWIQILFTIIVCLFGSIIFVIVSRCINNDKFELLMVAPICLFMVPLLFYQTFLAAINIPQPIVKQWIFPKNKPFEPPNPTQIKELLIISFEFKTNTKDPHFTRFRVKAPLDMDFGKLFYFFINNYDERHPNSKIQIIDDAGKVYGWIFYKKPQWYTIRTKYIDFNNTFFVNKIKQNDIIICKRLNH